MTAPKTILIAGGSGLIGRSLSISLRERGHSVLILTRNPKSESDVFWNPYLGKIDNNKVKNVQVIINLIGEGIAEQKWTLKRKKELTESRVLPTQFLAEIAVEMKHLVYYIGASGVNCYGFDSEELITEDAPYGSDYLSLLVKDWESASDLFSTKCPVVKLRIATVLTNEGGLIEKFKVPLFFRCSPVFGNGKQLMSWIHLSDLCRLINFCVDGQISGTFNAVSNNDSGYSFAKMLLKTSKKWGFIFKTPSWIIRFVFGEMSIILLKGIRASNQKIRDAGFTFSFNTIESALNDVKKK
ncbi:MAG: TIGR01777 family oxidoreductase [Flavobacteriia bacterium]|nr:TIGR01777 family oxidoreductase [Flavobacteriia bacterium]